MSINTYALLQTAITNFFDDGELTTARIQECISLAESDMENDPNLELLAMEARATATLSTTSHYISVSDTDLTGFNGLKRIHINGDPQKEIKVVPASQLNRFYTSTTGKPRYAALVGDEIEFDRIPDSAYTVELLFYRLTPLSDSNTTNEIFPAFKNLYLYASLIHAAVFAKEDEGQYERMYEKAANKAMAKDKQKRFGAPLRQRPHPRVIA